MLNQFITRHINPMKRLVSFVLCLFALGCSASYEPEKFEKFDIYLEGATHKEFVDHMYVYARENRLNIQWFGWYEVEKAKKWFERTNEKSSFKIKIELMSEKNGSLFLVNRPNHKDRVYLSIDYADRTPEWLNVVKVFQEMLIARSWRIEEINGSST